MGDTTTPLLIRARQLLTMDPGPDDPIASPPPMGDRDALRTRDAHVVGLIDDGVVSVEGDRIGWVGRWADRPKRLRGNAVRVAEVECATPGWIDAHTHTVFAGWRQDEFTWRNLGADYLTILEEGGGILDSVREVRRTSTRALTDALIARCFEATRLGVTTLEVKSGYGLTVEDELKQLKAIERARSEVLLDLQATFLGAHAVPMRFRDDRTGYVELVCEAMIPAVAEQKLARFCDVFCDRGAFTPAEATRILEVGKTHGLIPRLHADELAPVGATEVAIAVGAASADHLEHVSPEAVASMAEAGVAAVLLPGVNLMMRHTPLAPARALMAAGVEVALATDFNPGSSSTQDIGLMMTLGCTMLGMTPGEVLRAVTRAAAKALRLEDRGVLAVGQRADLTVLAVDDYWKVPYIAGRSHVDGVIAAGELVYWRSADEVDG
ncbi:MAG: imidazolonepropionase [Myxococcota bacterium]